MTESRSTPPLKNPDFHARLVTLIGDMQPFAWAARVGISKGAFSRIWHEGTIPGPMLLRRITDATGVSIDWLITGQGPMFPGHDDVAGFRGTVHVLSTPGSNPLHRRRHSDGFVTVPLAHDHASAGVQPALGHEETTDVIAFRREWLEHELHADPHDLYLVFVEGESMEPLLRPRDLVLVNRHDANHVPRDGLYVVRLNGTLLIKRLQRIPGHRLRLSSENPAYQEIVVDLDDHTDEVSIVGRVIWVGRRF